MLCLRNFKCNGVDGHPGKKLSKQEEELVQEFLPQLLRDECVRKEEVKPVVKEEAPKIKEDKKPKKASKKSE